jgi:hypothetical protein
MKTMLSCQRYAQALLTLAWLSHSAGCDEGHNVTVGVQTLTTARCEQQEPLAHWPEDRQCALVRVVDAEDQPIGLQVPRYSQNYEAVLMPRTSANSRQLKIDLNGNSPEAKVQLMVFGHQDDSGESRLVAYGTSPLTRLCPQCRVGVTLAPPSGFSCTGAILRGANPSQVPMKRRAFHSATPLKNGEVLLIGGLYGGPQGDELSRTSPVDAHLVRHIEVYDPTVGAFREVSVTNQLPDEDGSDLARLFHQAVVMTTSPERNSFRIRLLGGITADEGEAAIALRWALVSAGDVGTRRLHELAYSMPFGPTSATRPAAVADVIYFPGNRSAVIRPVNDGILAQVAYRAMAPAFTVGNELLVAGGVQFVPTDPELRWNILDHMYRTPLDNSPPTPGDHLDVRLRVVLGRVGHTATVLRDDPDQWLGLLWGGNVADVDGDGIQGWEDPCPAYDPGGDDACLADGDGDGVLRGSDNCPGFYNQFQTDENANTVGDYCDPDGAGWHLAGELVSHDRLRADEAWDSTPIRRDSTLPGSADANRLPRPAPIFHSAATVARDVALIYGGYRASPLGVGLEFAGGGDSATDVPGAYLILLGANDPTDQNVVFQSLDDTTIWPPVAFHTMTALDSPLEDSDPYREGAAYRVLVLGGANASGLNAAADRMAATDLARLFTFERLNNKLFAVRHEDLNLTINRWGHTATLLPDGRVLVAGGFKAEEGEIAMTPLWQAELFTPAPPPPPHSNGVARTGPPTVKTETGQQQQGCPSSPVPLWPLGTGPRSGPPPTDGSPPQPPTDGGTN